MSQTDEEVTSNISENLDEVRELTGDDVKHHNSASVSAYGAHKTLKNPLDEIVRM